jgi:hypothetical protein
MKRLEGTKELYIEHVPGLSDEQMSLHVTRHLPRRLAAGNVIMLHDRPAVFLAVIRKRWMHVIREIERERASTLDRQKRLQLEREIAHMKAYRFSTKPSEVERVEALILEPYEVLGSGLRCLSLYVTIPMRDEQLEALTLHVMEPGLLMIYEK